MAKFFYANTWHPELVNVIGDSSNGVNKMATVEYKGKDWLQVPSSLTASINLPNTGLYDFYLSFEYAFIPFDPQHQTVSDVKGETWSNVYNRSHIWVDTTARDGSGDYYYLSILDIKRLQRITSGYTYDAEESVKQFFAGKKYGGVTISSSGGCSGLERLLGTEPGKFLVHFSKTSSPGISAMATTNKGKGNKQPTQSGAALRLNFYGYYIRNIIISEEPISYSDTIREVSVDSITGNGWYTSNGKTYTENVNATANIKLNSASLAEAKKAVEARKFAFSGVSNRQGERINALEVKRANEAHQSLVDVGEHVFGSSWGVNSPSEITDTLTLTTRKVVGK